MVSSEKSCLCSDVVGGGSEYTHVALAVGPLAAVLGPGFSSVRSAQAGSQNSRILSCRYHWRCSDKPGGVTAVGGAEGVGVGVSL